MIGFSRITRRTAPYLAAFAALLFSACAPQVDKDKKGGRGEDTTGTAAGDRSSRSSTETTSSIEFRAEAPPAGFKLPFPDALPADDIEIGKRGGNFTYVVFGEPKTFNAIIANESSSNDIITRCFDPLLDYDYKNQKYYPKLLKECYMDGDAKTWLMKLRDGIKWSDGQPITADDIIFTMQAIYDPKVVTPAKDTLQIAGKPIAFEKVDNLTVRARLPEQSGSFHVMMSSVQIVPKHVLEADLKAGRFEQAYSINTPPEKIVCSGPFKIRQYAQAERVILERNPQYYKYDKSGQQLPYLETFTFASTPDQDAMLLRFTSGQADGVGSPKMEMVAGLRDNQKNGNYTLHDVGPGNFSSYLWFNLKRGSNPKSGKPYTEPWKQEVFNNENFRKAALHSINKQAIINSLLRGHAVPLWANETPALNFWHNPDVIKYDYDPAKAAALLDEAGYKDTNNDGVREDGKGNPITFTFVTNKGNKSREEIAQVLASDMKKVGLDARPQFVEFNTLVSMINDTYEYDGCYLAFGGSIHPITSMNSWKSSGRTHFHNPLQEKPATPWEAEVDKLANAFSVEIDPGKQQEIYFKMQAIFAEHCANLPLWVSKFFMASRNTFGNIKPTALIDLFWNADEIYVKDAGAASAPAPAVTVATPASTPAPAATVATPAPTPAPAATAHATTSTASTTTGTTTTAP